MRQDRLFHLRHRPKAARAILDSDARRAAPHITYLRCDALTGTRGRVHRLLPLEVGKRRNEARVQFHLLSHAMPPRCVQRIVRAPPGDILPVRCTRAVLVDVRRTERSLRVQRGKRVHIAPPRMGIQDVECLVGK